MARWLKAGDAEKIKKAKAKRIRRALKRASLLGIRLEVPSLRRDYKGIVDDFEYGDKITLGCRPWEGKEQLVAGIT